MPTTAELDQIINRKGTACTKWDYEFTPQGVPQPRISSDDVLAIDNQLQLWIADMDFRSPQAVIDALVARAQHGIFGYTMPPQSYYDAIIGWMQKRHNWTIKQEWILSSPGVKPSLSAILQAFTQPGDGVLIQTPIYHPFYDLIERNGREIMHNPLIENADRYEIDWADFEQKVANPKTTMVMLCHPHNPVGRVWTHDELKRMGQLCVEHNAYFAADEIHADLTFPWSNLATIGVACADTMHNNFVCTSPTKTFNLPGLKASNVIVSNPDLRAKVQNQFLMNNIRGINLMGAVALEAAYAHGEAWLNDVMAYVEANYWFTKEYISEHLPQLNLYKPEASYLLWVDCRALGLEANELHNILCEKANVKLNKGSVFGDAGAGFMRINIGCPRPILAAALERMCRTLQEV